MEEKVEKREKSCFKVLCGSGDIRYDNLAKRFAGSIMKIKQKRKLGTLSKQRGDVTSNLNKFLIILLTSYYKPMKKKKLVKISEKE